MHSITTVTVYELPGGLGGRNGFTSGETDLLPSLGEDALPPNLFIRSLTLAFFSIFRPDNGLSFAEGLGGGLREGLEPRGAGLLLLSSNIFILSASFVLLAARGGFVTLVTFWIGGTAWAGSGGVVSSECSSELVCFSPGLGGLPNFFMMGGVGCLLAVRLWSCFMGGPGGGGGAVVGGRSGDSVQNEGSEVTNNVQVHYKDTATCWYSHTTSKLPS